MYFVGVVSALAFVMVVLGGGGVGGAVVDGERGKVFQYFRRRSLRCCHCTVDSGGLSGCATACRAVVLIVICSYDGLPIPVMSCTMQRQQPIVC